MNMSNKKAKWTALFGACAVAVLISVGSDVHGMTMQQLFDDSNSLVNVTSPGVIQGQTTNVLTGGSLFLRNRQQTYSLASMSAPSYSAGCGGIDLYGGGFSYINKDQFVAMLKNIGSNAVGYAFKLALQNICPSCDNVMQALQSTANWVNNLNIDSCQAAEGLVNATVDTVKGNEAANWAKSLGVANNNFSDVTDAWQNVAANWGKTKEQLDEGRATDPSLSDKIPTGNVVWKALRKNTTLDNATLEFMMSLTGTVIYPEGTTSDTTAPAPITYEPLDLSVEVLMRGYTSAADPDTETLTMYSCVDTDECLNITTQQVNITSFFTMVSTRVDEIMNAIADRTGYVDPEGVWQFVNTTDLPIYKLIAVTTSLNNTTQADATIGRYKELIAAKYAEAYILMSVKSIRAAYNNYKRAGSTTFSVDLDGFDSKITDIMRQAQTAVADAYQRANTTISMAQEVQTIERALTSNLSQPLRASLNFGKSLSSR